MTREIAIEETTTTTRIIRPCIHLRNDRHSKKIKFDVVEQNGDSKLDRRPSSMA